MQAKYCHVTTVCCVCVHMYKYMYMCYREGGVMYYNNIIIAGNFHQFNFTNMHTHAHYVLYNRAYFVGLIFVVRLSVKIRSLENFSLYSSHAMPICFCFAS